MLPGFCCLSTTTVGRRRRRRRRRRRLSSVCSVVLREATTTRTTTKKKQKNIVDDVAVADDSVRNEGERPRATATFLGIGPVFFTFFRLISFFYNQITGTDANEGPLDASELPVISDVPSSQVVEGTPTSPVTSTSSSFLSLSLSLSLSLGWPHCSRLGIHYIHFRRPHRKVETAIGYRRRC